MSKTAKYNINFVGISKPMAIVSIILMISCFYLFIAKGFNLGVDFKGGIVIEIRPENEVTAADMRKFLEKETKNLPISEINIQDISKSKDILIRLGEKSKTDKERVQLVESVKQIIIKKSGENTDFRKVDFVGPQVGSELIESGALAVALAFLGMMVYIWFRFEWQYGFGGILALFHDAILVLGMYSISGLEFNLTSVAAVLTVVGYSINDSVVIYDRIRENLRKYRKMPFAELLNLSLNETLSRTILTSLTIFLAVLALVAVGGEALFGFSFAILFGVVVGTYSSIYVSVPILLLFQPDQAKKNSAT